MDYLLKAAMVMAIFYFAYKWFLQHETFFNSNRFFLLIGLIIALFLPLIVIPIYVEVASQNFNPIIMSDKLVSNQATTEHISLIEILLSIYGAGVIFFFGKFLVNMLSLFNIIRRNPSENRNGIYYVKTNDAIAPFSFFNWIVYNPNTFKNDELQLILNHEHVHVKQGHSIDVIFAEITCIIFWFNPIVWFYKKALQQNLEFIADQQAQSKIDCNRSYQRLLLKASIPTNQLVIANNFYNSLIKKRIVMLHKSKSNNLNGWKYALVVPALALFLMSFNTKKVYFTETTSETRNSDLNEILSINANSTNSELKDIESYFSSKTVRVKFSDINRNPDKTIRQVTIKTKHDDDTKFLERITVHNDNGNTITPFKLMLSDNGKEILFQSKNAIPVLISKHNITFNEEAIVSKPQPSINKDINSTLQDPKILYFLNGKEITHEEMNRIDPKTINKIDVIKDTEQLKKYGDKGKDGVIIITTGEATNKSMDIPEKALILINDKESTKKEMDALDPDSIQSVFVIKPELGKTKYGKKGKDGVIIITTEKAEKK